jgi:sulfur relay protein TusB/DsrH
MDFPLSLPDIAMSSVSDSGVLHVLCGQTGMRPLPALLLAAAAGDSVVLLQDAAWLALAPDVGGDVWAALPVGVGIMVLRADLELRGFERRALHPRVNIGDDTDWVAASERHARCITWGAG